MAVDPYIARGIQPVGDIGNALLQVESIKQGRSRNALADREMTLREKSAGQDSEIRENLAKILEGDANPAARAKYLAEMRAEGPQLAGVPDDQLWAGARSKTFALAGYTDPTLAHKQKLEELEIRNKYDLGAAEQENVYDIQNDEREAAAARELAGIQASKAYGLADVGHRNRLAEIEAQGSQARETQAAKPPKSTALSSTDATRAKIKLNSISLARKQLAQAKKNFEAIRNTFSAGPGADKVMYTQAGKVFDKSVDTMRGTISGLTRTPGVGAMSDYETKLDQAKMPNRGEYEAATAEQIAGLELLLNEMEAGYRELLGGAPSAAPPSAGGGGAPAARIRFDAQGNRIP